MISDCYLIHQNQGNHIISFIEINQNSAVDQVINLTKRYIYNQVNADDVIDFDNHLKFGAQNEVESLMDDFIKYFDYKNYYWFRIKFITGNSFEGVIMAYTVIVRLGSDFISFIDFDLWCFIK